MQFRRRLKPEVNLNIVPMIDVVFQLVLFFMVATTFVITPGISLVLPSSATAEKVAVSKLVVTVVSTEEVYLNRERYTLSGLDRKLSEMSQKEKTEVKSVVLEGDRSISYSLLVRVLDVLRRNGFKGINLKTREAWSANGS